MPNAEMPRPPPERSYPFFQLYHVELCLLSFLLGDVSTECGRSSTQPVWSKCLGDVLRLVSVPSVKALTCWSVLFSDKPRLHDRTLKAFQSPFNCLLLLKNHLGKLIASVKLCKTFSEHNTLRVLSCLSSRAHCSVKTKQVFPRGNAALNSSVLLWQRQLLVCAYTYVCSMLYNANHRTARLGTELGTLVPLFCV